MKYISQKGKLLFGNHNLFCTQFSLAFQISNICLPADEELANSVLQSTEIVLEILREMTADAQRHAEVLSKKDSTTKVCYVTFACS